MGAKVGWSAGLAAILWSAGTVASAQGLVIEGLDSATYARDWVRVDLPDGTHRYVVADPVYVRDQNRGITVAQFDADGAAPQRLDVFYTHQSCDSGRFTASASQTILLAGQIGDENLIQMPFTPIGDSGWFRDLWTWACEGVPLPNAGAPLHGLDAVLADARALAESPSGLSGKPTA